MNRETNTAYYRSDAAGIAQLAAEVAHEIRNPLTVVQGFVRLLKRGADPRCLDMMESELSRIEALVEDFLQLTRPAVPRKDCIRAEKLIRETADLFLGRAQAQGVVLKVRPLPPGLWFEGNEPRVKQVLMNVLKNALEAMPHGGTIELEASMCSGEDVRGGEQNAGDWIRIAVYDEGVGLTDEQLARAEEPFFTTKENGTGLGLAVCRRIMAEHAGRLAIGRRQGGGAQVFLFFPKKGS
jgi:signal transduction histidine kinase